MSESTLLEALIDSVKETNKSVKTLSDSVNALVTSEQVRIESDKRQQEINDELSVRIKSVDVKITKFMEDNADALSRAKRFHATFDKVSTGIISLIAIALLALLGFNFK